MPENNKNKILILVGKKKSEDNLEIDLGQENIINLHKAIQNL